MTHSWFGNLFLSLPLGKTLLDHGIFHHLNMALSINQGHIKAHICGQRAAGICKIFCGGLVEAFLLPVA